MNKPQPRVTEVSKPYWDGLNQGRIVLQRCLHEACRRVIFYPRVCCPFCKRAGLEWVDASGSGRVVSHTTVQRTHHDGFNAEAPYVFAAPRISSTPLSARTRATRRTSRPKRGPSAP